MAEPGLTLFSYGLRLTRRYPARKALPTQASDLVATVGPAEDLNRALVIEAVLLRHANRSDVRSVDDGDEALLASGYEPLIPHQANSLSANPWPHTSG